MNRKRKLILRIGAALVILALLALYVTNASRPGRTVQGCPDGCARASTRQAGPLRVVSLNMLHGFPLFSHLPLRLELIASEIQRLDADVVLLQEVPWTVRTGHAAGELSRQLGYNYLYYRANGNRWLIFFEESEAILSRFPLKDPVFTELLPRMGFFESRVSLGATAVTPWGEMRFFVTHLTDKTSQVNQGQAESLLRFVESHSNSMAVIGGDFNARPDSPQIMQLSKVWKDTYALAHPGDAGLTCCIDNLQSTPGEPLEQRIDYIFLVGGGQVVDVQHIFNQPFKVGDSWQWASDHTGLMLEIAP